MSDYSATADALTGRSELETTLTISGDSLPIKMREPDLGELDAIEEDLPDDAEDIDVAREMIDRLLLEPDISPSDIPMGHALALMAEMQNTIQNSDAVKRAQEQMPLDQNQGNR
jgi:hypothetical protein